MLKRKLSCNRSTVILLAIILFFCTYNFYSNFLLSDFWILGKYHLKYQVILRDIILVFVYCIMSYYFSFGKRYYIYSAFGLALFPIALYNLMALNNATQIFVIVYLTVVFLRGICRILSVRNCFVETLTRFFSIIILLLGIVLAGIVFVKNMQLPVEIKKEDNMDIIIKNVASFKKEASKEKQIIAQKILHRESKLLEIDEPKVYLSILTNNGIAGFTNRTSHNIYINSNLDDVYEFVATVLHEFYHYVQYELVYNNKKSRGLINRIISQRIKAYKDELNRTTDKSHNLLTSEIDADCYSRSRILDYLVEGK